MSLSYEVLANIKTNDSSDEGGEGNVDASELLMEMTQYPAVVQANLGELDSEHFDYGETEDVQDPLQQNAEKINEKCFQGEYKEEDYLYDNGWEAEPWDNGMADSAKHKNKRARIGNEVKGQNGFLWSTIRTAEDIAMTTGNDILQLQPRGKGPACEAENPLEVWFLLLDEPILIQLVTYTNAEIKLRKGKVAYQRCTDLTELRAWVGLNYLCGLFRNAQHPGPLDELWTLELGNSIFRLTMSLKRFEFIADCLRCSEQIRKKKSLDIVSHVWEKFVTNCRSYYAPSENCAIDEHIMVSADPLCPFKTCLPNNQSEKGLRLVTLCDAKTLYMCNALVATDPKRRERDILYLVCDIKGTKRNITLNERYTTLAVANKMYQCQLTTVGPLSTNAPEVPSEVLSLKTQGRLYVGPTALIFGLNPNGSPTSLLLSNGNSPRINAVKLYHCTCACCKRFQQLSSTYSTGCAASNGSSRWTLQFLRTMLDYAALNAWILLRLSDKGDASLTQRDFLRQLGMYLTQPHLKRRLQYNSKLTLMQKLQLSEMLGESTERLLCDATVKAKDATCITVPGDKALISEDIKLASKFNTNRLRCRKCPSKNGNKTRNRCQQCLMPLCNRHLISRCMDCTGAQEIPEEEEAMQDDM